MMVSQFVDEAIHHQLVLAMHMADRPMSSHELQQYLSTKTNVYVIGDILHRHLAHLERCGEVVSIPQYGRNPLWHLADGRLNATAAPAHAQRAGDCIKILRTDGVLLKMNSAGCAALGLPMESTDFGMPWLELLPSQFRRSGSRALHTASNGTAARFAGLSLGGAQPQRWDNVLTPIEDNDGRIRTVLCVSRAITEAYG